MNQGELDALPWVETPASRNVHRLAYVDVATAEVRVEAPEGVRYEDSSIGAMYVQFCNKVSREPTTIYEYDKVPRGVYEAIRDAQSVGSMLHKLIDGKYPYALVDAEPDEVGEVDLRELMEALLRQGAELQAAMLNLTRLIQGASRPRPQREVH